MRGKTGIERTLNKHATTILLGGVFLSFSILLYLTLCNMPCDDPTYAGDHDELKQAQSQAFWRGHILAPQRDLKTFLFVLVISGPKNLHQRDVVRETWASMKSSEVMVRFSVGLGSLSEEEKAALLRENLVHKDLLLLKNFSDSYQLLPHKLLESFKWIDGNVDFKYVLKADEDSFVRLEKMITELKSKPKERLYWGFFDGRAHVKKSGKWKEKDWILCDRYLPYALGGGYVISNDLVHYVVTNAKYLKVFNNEDTSLGVWLGPLDIHRVHDPRFDTEYKSRGCKNVYIVRHKQTALQMRELQRNVQEIGHMCSKEEHLRNSYIYNWNVLPSECCIRNDSTVP